MRKILIIPLAFVIGIFLFSLATAGPIYFGEYCIDCFEDGSINTSLWNVTNSASYGATSETGGYLQLEVTNGNGGPQIETVELNSSLDLTNIYNTSGIANISFNVLSYSETGDTGDYVYAELQIKNQTKNQTITKLSSNGISNKIGGIYRNATGIYYWYDGGALTLSSIQSGKIGLKFLIFDNQFNGAATLRLENVTYKNSTVIQDNTLPVISLSNLTGIYDFGVSGKNFTLVYNVSDDFLSSCWYDYNGTNITVPCSNGIANSTIITTNTKKNLTFYALDLGGNNQSAFISWDYKLFSNGQTYNTVTTEGAIESFQINLTVKSGYRITTGNLIYNGTSYAATISLNGNTYLLRSIAIPDVSTTQNTPFYWHINLDDSSEINTTSLIQVVQSLGIDNCSTYTNQLFNITMYDEDTQTFLSGGPENTSIKISFTISSMQGIQLLNYSKNFAYTNPARLCLQNPLNTSVFRLDGLIEYSSLSRFQEYYNFQNYNLTNSTSNVKISLYNLFNSSKAQEFKIVYKDSSFRPVSGAILQIQRKYIDEGVFKTTEIPKTGTEGYTIAHLIRNDAIYNIIVLKDGEVLATFTDIVADCQNPFLSSCQINLNSYGSTLMPDSFETVNDIIFSPSFNKTSRKISVIYSIVSGVTSTVDLNVTLFNAFGNTSVCSDSLYSSGGQLSCTIPSSFGNSTVIVKIFKDGIEVGQGVINLAQDPSDIYGGNLIFVGLIVAMIFVGIAASNDNPMISGILLGLGAIVLVSINIIYTPSLVGVGATILWFIAAIVILLIKGANRQ